LTPLGYTEDTAAIKEAFKEAMEVIVKEYMSRMAEALRRDYPEMTFRDIKRKVIEDGVEIGWSPTIIRRYWH
jgi:hypothetical protein